MRRSGIRRWSVAAALCAAAALLVSCDSDSPTQVRLGIAPPVLIVPARIASVVPGRTDTSVTLLRYDSTGTLYIELRPTTIREWDSLGRYVSVRRRHSDPLYDGDEEYLEQARWITEDSAVRTQPPSVEIRDRFFNRRKNCWCADSIRHSFDGAFRVTRKFEFDAHDNPIRVTLNWVADSSVDVVQAYTNTYDRNGRLVEVYAQDGESGTVVTTLRSITYDTLKNVIIARPSSRGTATIP